jgi:hypothetical protein
MSQSNRKAHAALTIAGLALALSAYTAVRGRSAAPAAGSGACIDPEARAQADRLRRALVERDAVIARLARAANVPGETRPVEAPASTDRPEPEPDRASRRYARFEIPNPAVSVTQKADGKYEIRTTDPSLAGTVMQITGVTEAGHEDKMLIRIPAPQ